MDEKYNHNRIYFPEKIIFIIDTICEPFATQFKLGTGAKYRTLVMIKRIIEVFINNKLMLNQKHEFAIITLDSQNALWLCDFTRNLKHLLNVIESIEENVLSENQKYFNIQQVFELVHQNIISKRLLLQNSVIRTILLYCRSNTIPKFNTTEMIVQELIQYHNFFLDILYIHESSNSENKCEEIYAELTKLDIKNISYIMEVTRSAVKIHNNMARLLAHPFQRVPQRDIKYSLHSSVTKVIDENKI